MHRLLPAFRKGGRAFQEVWKSSWSEWKNWCSAHLAEAAAGLSHSYQAYSTIGEARPRVAYPHVFVDSVEARTALILDAGHGRIAERQRMQLNFEEELANRPVALARAMDSAPAGNPPRGDGEWIIAPGCLRTERWRAGDFPLLWNEDPRETWEGFVDMVIFAGDRERCRIVDWKTDRWRKGMTAEYLRNRYSPQIRVYLRALGGITRLPVEAGIYLTVTGEFLEIDDVS